MPHAVLLSRKILFSFGAQTHGVKGIGTAVADQLVGFCSPSIPAGSRLVHLLVPLAAALLGEECFNIELQ